MSTENLKDLQGETKEEIITKLQTSERICKKMTLQIEQQQSDLSKQKGILHLSLLNFIQSEINVIYFNRDVSIT